MKTYKEIPKSFGMQLLSFAPKHTQIFMLIDNFNKVCTENIRIYIVRSPRVLSVQFFIRRCMHEAPELPMIYISFDRFPLGIQEFLKKLLTE